jgi:hypothetical protein
MNGSSNIYIIIIKISSIFNIFQGFDILLNDIALSQLVCSIRSILGILGEPRTCPLGSNL